MEKGLAVVGGEPEGAPVAVETPTQQLAQRYVQVADRRAAQGKVPFRGTPGGWKKRRASIMAMVMRGASVQEVADAFEMSYNAVRQILYRMRHNGELKDTEDRLDHGIIPDAIAALEKLIASGDKDAILAVLKGRGAFKNHTAGGTAAGTAQVMTNLVVKFEMPAGGGPKPVLAGQVVGVPRDVEVEK